MFITCGSQLSSGNSNSTSGILPENTHVHTETYTYTNRHTHTLGGDQTDINIYTNRNTHIHTYRETDTYTQRDVGRQKDRQT